MRFITSTAIDVDVSVLEGPMVGLPCWVSHDLDGALVVVVERDSPGLVNSKQLK
jgi:hypothetical protein